ncbi:MAG: 23S rRNA (uracil(1939)-C(5))-methyltransferase RlmD [Mucinivorans sp.]
MSQKKSKYPIIESLAIIDMAAEGKSLGKVEEQVVFVPNTVPGDVVRVQINNKRRRFMEGYVLDYLILSPLRVEPLCKHYGECGGCKWQALPYANQLEFKQRQVRDQLTRLSGVEIPNLLPIIGSKLTENYRNKLEFTFSPKRWIPRAEALEGVEILPSPALGFHIPGMFDKILDIEKCYLQAEPSNAIRLAVKEFAVEHDMAFYDIRLHTGLLRNLVIRTSTTGELMVIVVFGEEQTEPIKLILDFIANKFVEITSLYYIVNTKLNDSSADQQPILHSGKAYIEEEMEGLRFRINPKSFYQTNSLQAHELYKVVRDFAELTGSETVYDLYTGAGTIANFVARQSARVIGIEYVNEAIEDAKVNSKLNSIPNTEFFAGDMKDVLNGEFIAAHGYADVVILDPPRAGIHEDVAKVILEASPQKIVYVSCNPATQARDIALFDCNYKVTKVQPVDMFPHTHHVENVVQLIKR